MVLEFLEFPGNKNTAVFVIAVVTVEFPVLRTLYSVEMLTKLLKFHVL